MDFPYLLFDQSEVISSLIFTTARIQNSDLLTLMSAKWRMEGRKYFRLGSRVNCVHVYVCVWLFLLSFDIVTNTKYP